MNTVNLNQFQINEPAFSDASNHAAQKQSPAEILPAPVPPAPPVEILTETLMNYGFKASDENKAMLLLMLENGIPLTKENVLRMNQALKLTSSSEKALFVLHNNIKLTQANAAQLNELAGGQFKLNKQLSNLISAVEQLSDKDVAAQLRQIIFGAKPTQNFSAQTQISQTTEQIQAEMKQMQTSQETAQEKNFAQNLNAQNSQEKNFSQNSNLQTAQEKNFAQNLNAQNSQEKNFAQNLNAQNSQEKNFSQNLNAQ
ncbi:MAG: hypothetical protein FWD19_03230, partial [Defluviitaleaceae bacterium]|nr:hypothetical protein [Defluviitaleaceae bacterium]